MHIFTLEIRESIYSVEVEKATGARSKYWYASELWDDRSCRRDDLPGAGGFDDADAFFHRAARRDGFGEVSLVTELSKL